MRLGRSAYLNSRFKFMQVVVMVELHMFDDMSLSTLIDECCGWRLEEEEENKLALVARICHEVHLRGQLNTDARAEKLNIASLQNVDNEM